VTCEKPWTYFTKTEVFRSAQRGDIFLYCWFTYRYEPGDRIESQELGIKTLKTGHKALKSAMKIGK